MASSSQFQGTLELAKGAHYTVVLGALFAPNQAGDENLRSLKAGLEDEGYKVVLPPAGASDRDIKELAKGGWTILTRNSNDFVDDALHYDYDIIALEDVKFVDGKPDRTNGTVVKVAGRAKAESTGVAKGQFRALIRDDGSFHLRQLP